MRHGSGTRSQSVDALAACEVLVTLSGEVLQRSLYEPLCEVNTPGRFATLRGQSKDTCARWLETIVGRKHLTPTTKVVRYGSGKV